MNRTIKKIVASLMASTVMVSAMTSLTGLCIDSSELYSSWNFDITYKERDESANVISSGVLNHGYFIYGNAEQKWEKSGIRYEVTSYDNNTVEVHCTSDVDLVSKMNEQESDGLYLVNISMSEKARVEDGVTVYPNAVTDTNYLLNTNMYKLNEEGTDFSVIQAYNNDLKVFLYYIYITKSDLEYCEGKLDIDLLIEAPRDLNKQIPLSFGNSLVVNINGNRNLGDANNDGICNATDAANVLIYAASKGAGNEVDADTDRVMKANCDMNNDGESNATDAANILIYAAYKGAGNGNLSVCDYMSNNNK